MNSTEIRQLRGWTFLQSVYADDALRRLQSGESVERVQGIADSLSLGSNTSGPEAEAVTHVIHLWTSERLAKILKAPDAYLQKAWHCSRR